MGDQSWLRLPAEGAIWVQTQDSPHGAVVRIREGGEVLERIEHDRAIFVLMLGGSDLPGAGRERFVHVLDAAPLVCEQGQRCAVLITEALAPGAGWP